MKKLLILLLLLPSLAWGQEYARMNPYILGGGASAAAACSTPAGGIFSEGLETPGKEETWTDVGGGTVTWNSALAGLSGGAGNATVNCTYGVRFLSTADNPSYSYLNMGETKADLYIEFSIYVDSESLGNGESANILKVCNAANETAAGCHNQLALSQSSGGDLRWAYYDNTTATYTADGTWAADNWYYVKMYFKDADAGCYVKIGTTYGGTEILNDTVTCKDVSANPQYVFVGSQSWPRILDLYFGYISGDADGTF